MVARYIKNLLWCFINRYRGYFYGNLDLSSRVSLKARVAGAKNIFVGEKVRIWNDAIIRCSAWGDPDSLSGSIRVGRGTVIGSHACIWTCGGNVQIGEDCSVNSYSILYGHGGLTIGDNVRIAAHVVIIPSNHNFSSKSTPILKQGGVSRGIVIGDDVWIGASSVILDGVTISEGSVIGAGSVVTKSTEAYGVYVGSPAKKIRDRV